MAVGSFISGGWTATSLNFTLSINDSGLLPVEFLLVNPLGSFFNPNITTVRSPATSSRAPLIWMDRF